jgi:hypothetical protein
MLPPAPLPRLLHEMFTPLNALIVFIQMGHLDFDSTGAFLFPISSGWNAFSLFIQLG